jgi:hypothetical protein
MKDAAVATGQGWPNELRFGRDGGIGAGRKRPKQRQHTINRGTQQ